MPATADELSKEVLRIQQSGLIPALLVVYDEASGEELGRHMLGCFAVPRVGEVVRVGGAKVGVFGVCHDFNAARGAVRLQVITVAGYAERPAGAARRRAGRPRNKEKADSLFG